MLMGPMYIQARPTYSSSIKVHGIVDEGHLEQRCSVLQKVKGRTRHLGSRPVGMREWVDTDHAAYAKKTRTVRDSYALKIEEVQPLTDGDMIQGRIQCWARYMDSISNMQ